MRRALQIAVQAARQDEIPVGAVLVHSQSGKIIAHAHNATTPLKRTQKAKKNTPLAHMPIAHAEILVLIEGCQKTGIPFLEDYTLYTTLEPCHLCASAIAFSRVGTLVFGAYNPKGGAITHGARLFDQSTFSYKPKVIGGVCEKASHTLLKSYFQNKRQL